MIQANKVGPRVVRPFGHNDSSMANRRLKSRFEGDPEMREIVALFVAEMPARMNEVAAAWREGDLERVRTIAHQIKGAAGGYGFPEIGASAGALEALLRRTDSTHASIESAVREFLEMLSRAMEAD